MPKILLIDDDADFREACRVFLESAGFDVSDAGNPEEGISKVRTENPDLVILDVLMPSEYEGFGVARRIREELKMTTLPILMLTAVHEVKGTPYRFQPDQTFLPVEAFLDKPVPPETLVRKVHEMLGMHRETPQEPL
ncbi:MAG TPA: response regulator [Candidatus Hydrogenedentes bacterium]|nr:response regulator [Candidatus Hydrogenedentota bacterium]HPG68850.1 response regulator [Candidatus Hydrogenedentota bacterium]